MSDERGKWSRRKKLGRLVGGAGSTHGRLEA